MAFIDQIVNHVIRPQREEYHIKRLGSPLLEITPKYSTHSLSYCRQDFGLVNPSDRLLQVSYYSCPHQQSDTCVIYLHANNGSRIEGLPYLRSVLASSYNFCLFDFAGSGISEGDYVSLGFHEAQDVRAVVQFLLNYRKIKNVVLWGRSMGAVAALIYAAHAHPCVRALILDSPFKDLEKLIKEIASERTGLPRMFFQPLLFFVRERIREKANFNLQDLKIKKYLSSNSFVDLPALFMMSKSDKMVGHHHGQKLFRRYGGKKEIRYISIQHHENRPLDLIDECLKFIQKSLQKQEKEQISRLNYMITPKIRQFNLKQNSIPSKSSRQPKVNEIYDAETIQNLNRKISLSNLRNCKDYKPESDRTTEKYQVGPSKYRERRNTHAPILK